MRTRRTKLVPTIGVLVAATALIAGCTGNSATGGTSSTTGAGAGGSTANGKTIKIGFSAPAADHGWMGAITKAAQAEAAKHSDVQLVMAEGTNDVNLQISQIETFINDKVDAIVMLPFDGAALTAVATKAMKAGIPVINVDREFSSPFAARSTVLGRQLRHGRLGRYVHVREVRRQPEGHHRRDRGHRLPAADAGSQQGLRRRARRVRAQGVEPGGC